MLPESGERELVECSSEIISILEKFSLPSPINLIPLPYQEYTYRNNNIAKNVNKSGFQPNILGLDDANATKFVDSKVAFNIDNNSSSCGSKSIPTTATTTLITNVGTVPLSGKVDNILLLDSGSTSISTTLAVIDSVQNRMSYQVVATPTAQNTSAENDILPTISMANDRNLLPEMMMMMMTAANVNVGNAGKSVVRAVENHYSYV